MAVLAYESEYCSTPDTQRPYRMCGGYALPTQTPGTSSAARSTNRARRARAGGNRSCWIPAASRPGPCQCGRPVHATRILSVMGFHPLQFERQVNHHSPTAPRRAGASAPWRPSPVARAGSRGRIRCRSRLACSRRCSPVFTISTVPSSNRRRATGPGEPAWRCRASDSNRQRTMERYLGALQWTP